TPRAFTSAERDSVVTRFSRWYAGDYNPPERQRPPQVADRFRREGRAAIEAALPRTSPPVREIQAGVDGTIWLLREYQVDRDRWEVYDAEMRLLGAVEFSSRTPMWDVPRIHVRLLRASLDEVWGVEVDELEVPYV